jgi:hypothetical protein
VPPPGRREDMRTERAHCAVHRHEPHVRPGDLFADRLGANGIVLIALHIGLQTGGFSRTSWPSAPEVRATNNVTTHRPRYGLARRQLLEEDVAALDLTTEDGGLPSIGPRRWVNACSRRLLSITRA